MADLDTFLTPLYVNVDDYCKTLPAPVAPRPGPAPSLSPSEVVTLALYARWGRWDGQRDFYRYAGRHLRAAFPRLPHRTQFNRLLRRHTALIAALALHFADLLAQPTDSYQILDTTAVPVRNAKRRGRSWFVGLADIGYSPRLGWYYGFHLLTAVSPAGAITGWGFGAASAKDQPLAEAFLALRLQPQGGYATVGRYSSQPYLADGGFAGVERHARWGAEYGAQVLSPPNSNSKVAYPREWRHWLTRLRQMVETGNDKLHNRFHLQSARPHTWQGLHAGIAATVGLHNFCIWLNRQLGRADLAFAELLDW